MTTGIERDVDPLLYDAMKVNGGNMEREWNREWSLSLSTVDKSIDDK